MPQDNDMGTFNSPSVTMKAANFQVVTEKVVTNIFKRSINSSCELITTIGGFILIVGVVLGTLNALIAVINGILGTDYQMIMSVQRSKNPVATFTRARHQLGEKTAYLSTIPVNCEHQLLLLFIITGAVVYCFHYLSISDRYE